MENQQMLMAFIRNQHLRDKQAQENITLVIKPSAYKSVMSEKKTGQIRPINANQMSGIVTAELVKYSEETCL